ncbi:MAG: hypothetical protein PWP23_893 [Candidatus Sumerlaeota bacterium]|nr:hypothetical protein [Candidatus Sumerlaeota bacterium]
MMGRFSPWVCGPLTAIVLMASGVGVPAANDDMRPAITGEETAAPPERLKLEFSAFQVELNESSAFGSIVETDEITGLASEDGSTQKIARMLQRSGEVSLLYRGESTGATETPFTFYIGEEEPLLTTYLSSDGATRSTSQSTVSSGLNAQFTPDVEEDGDISFKYEVDLDRAFTVDRDGQTLIGRVRLSWKGETLLHEGEGAQVGRFVRQLDGKQVEFVFVLRVVE